MKLTNLRCAPIPLLFLLTMACTAPPDAPPTDGVPVPQPRVWLGLALAGEGSTPNSVEFVTDAAYAAEDGLQAGDVLVNLAGREISGPADLGETVSTLRARQTVEAVVTRNGGKLSFQITPGLLVFQEAPPIPIVDDKRCDEKCRCSIEHPGALCGRGFYHHGDGPNGGVLYTIICVAFGDDFKKLPGSGNRGPLEFF